MSQRLILCLGDIFIPDRALDIPPKFKKLLTPGKIGTVLCLGNLTDKETYEFLRSIAPELHIVRGDFDVEAANLPLHRVFQPGSNNNSNNNNFNSTSVGNIPNGSSSPPSTNASSSQTSPPSSSSTPMRIGYTHSQTVIPPGDPDSLLMMARQLDVDVLLWGGTHRFEAYELEGKFFVNPGSITGAMTTNPWTEADDPTPSFVLMDVQGDVLVLYVYQLRKNDEGVENVSVEKVSFRRGGDTGGS